jgi:acetylornithine deacetylase/succinyl-diaminopimelate desuccinylase-like protein
MQDDSMETLLAGITAVTATEAFAEATADLLMRLCRIDTTPNPDMTTMRLAEDRTFCEIRTSLATSGAELEFRPVNPAIAAHPAFSQLHFTKAPGRPHGLSPEATYAGRGNLLARLAADADPLAPNTGRRPAVNAHIDVVAPYFPPRREGGRIFGRGANDDKASCVVMIQAAALLAKLRRQGLVQLRRPVLLMFVVEEETGGNGSLSLAIDRDLRREYDSLLVMECADLGLHPANRGAIWYRTELRTSHGSALGAATYAILAMEAEGAALRAESDHPQFPHRPVQTCHGILGPFGEHPSRICGQVVAEIGTALEGAALAALIERGLARYIETYGDKTQVPDPTTGKPKVARHYLLTTISPGRFRLEVFGSTGHMGSIRENDGAITKLAYLLREIMEGSPELPELSVPGVAADAPLILEGGQGFLPTHPIAAVMTRLAAAAERGVSDFGKRFGDPAATCTTTFEKLHNDAFAGDPDSPTMQVAKLAMERCGLRQPGAPVRGWDVSCDARLFAGEYPDLPVITSGPGKLRHAHADDEQVDLADLLAAIRFTVLYLLLETGSVR